ncbi:hypothetical protein D1007_26572 [Hordeum vulgare]|nr:hypothetical protein D1007_26572 [Hordeum vulgare]
MLWPNSANRPSRPDRPSRESPPQASHTAWDKARKSTINEQISKFYGYYQQILNRNQSGVIIAKQKAEALVLYKSKDPKNKPFALMHCCLDALDIKIRPEGDKRDKERLWKVRASASDGLAPKLSLETVWAQKLEKAEVKESAKNARYERAFELQEKQIAMQERLMLNQERERRMANQEKER